MDLAMLMLDRTEFETALSRLDAALKDSGGNQRALHYRGLVLDQPGRRGAAQEVLRAVSRGTEKYARKAPRHLRHTAS